MLDKNITELRAILGDLSKHAGKIEQIASLIVKALSNDKKLLFVGNGGSASDSQHLAAEFVGRFEKNRKALRALALTTDTSILTAVANDYGFESVFERQIEAIGKQGDILYASSTSGRSANILRACNKARKLGLTVIGLSGSEDSSFNEYCDIIVSVPSIKTSRIQEAHMLIGHTICELVEKDLGLVE